MRPPPLCLNLHPSLPLPLHRCRCTAAPPPPRAQAVIKDQNLVLSAADVKSYLQMLLRGLEACHAAWVLHRCGGMCPRERRLLPHSSRARGAICAI